MHGKSILRLYPPGQLMLHYAQRFYHNRNVLILKDRGLYDDLFPQTSASEMKDRLLQSPQTVYSGFDPTADSLHVGNLLVLTTLLQWQRAGHQVMVLIGGATGQIGDPSHRKKEREGINRDIMVENVENIKQNIETIFRNHKKYFWDNKYEKSNLKPLKIVNNFDWYKSLNVIDFISKVGKNFRLGTMMGRTSVQSRLSSEGGMSFTEFSYPVFQSYDWLYLLNHHNCYFQLGGQDQMGNIMSGHDFIRRVSNKEVYGLTVPLITAEGGKKFGKSVGNAIWLSSNRSSPFTFYQYFIRTTDTDIEQFLKFFTFLHLNDIKSIMEDHKMAPEKRKAQKILAEQVTLLVHGEEGLKAANETSAVLYEKSLDSLSKLHANEVLDIFEGANVVELPPEPGLTAYGLAMKINCFKTDHDALRIIPAGGFHINHSKVTNVEEVITPGIHILSNNLTLIRVGKKTYHLVKWLM